MKTGYFFFPLLETAWHGYYSKHKQACEPY